ncbi:MAG: proline--tRNA ligase [Legionellales bacterium]|nr:proline--tRNA ligase [Legionellales bacterium]
MSQKTAISPTRSEDYAEWYQQVIKAAELAENSSVRGCMVIKPWGYGLWEQIQQQLDQRFKALGHENIYCPLFIPLSHLQKEADHVEGFAKECAVVTHHRLQVNDEGKLIPASPLEEPLVVRPTSETIMGEVFANWVQSYRDLPILINQWANIVRWEMRTRLFLRTTEFLWQEGHTVHATREEAIQETLTMLNVYHEFVNDVMAIPVIKGEKSEAERFPGADNTYCIEAMMQDKKALQAGTSHFLGQNFAKAFQIRYLDQQGELQTAWTTSWGASTRLIGGLIMTHSDDDGLMLPPRIAPTHAVILPIIHDDADRQTILNFCDQVANELREQSFYGRSIQIKVDTRDMRGGDKSWQWIKKGVPLRIEIGKKELEENKLSVKRRDQAHRDRLNLSVTELKNTITTILQDMQNTIYQRALNFRQQHTHIVESRDEFYEFFKHNNGFVLAHWCGDAAIEKQIQEELSVTIRCLPLEHDGPGQCIFTGKPSPQHAIFARAY